MQNRVGTAVAAAGQRQHRDQALAAASQRDTAESLSHLQEAVLRLTQQVVRESPTSAPTSRRPKLGPNDDVEAYPVVFPSLAARAQRFHDWRFDIRGAVRPQISRQGRLIRRWLVDGNGPSLVDRVLIDNTIRQLPPEARRSLAHNHPNTVDELVRRLENWQVAQQLSFSIQYPARPAETRRDRRGPNSLPQSPPPRPPTLSQVPREDGQCFGCGRAGHLARQCPGDRDVSMPSAFAVAGQSGLCLLSTCGAHQKPGAPTLPVRVGYKDTLALGSQPLLVPPQRHGQTGRPAYSTRSESSAEDDGSEGGWTHPTGYPRPLGGRTPPSGIFTRATPGHSRYPDGYGADRPTGRIRKLPSHRVFGFLLDSGGRNESSPMVGHCPATG